MFESLLEEANKFLTEHLEYNEVELADGNIKVHVVRYTPVPITWLPPYQWQYSIPK